MIASTYVPLARLRIRWGFQANQTMFLKGDGNLVEVFLCVLLSVERLNLDVKTQIPHHLGVGI